jgi:SP family arabinose:H+ symporter-like MFS transporter
MPNSNRGSLLFVLFATCVTATGGFLFGYDTAVINGANSYIKAHWDLSDFQQGLVGASAILGCIPGAMFAGWLSDRFGRKRLLFLCAILYGLSAVLFLPALSPNLNQFLVARFICGLGIGASSMICPVYIAELAPEKWRGRLGTLFQLGIVVGILITLFVNKLIQGCGDDAWNAALGWRWMLGVGAVPAAVFLLLLLAVPESPRWLAQNSREEEARKILSRAGGAVHAEKQMTEIREAIGQEEGHFSELFGGVYLRPLVLAVVLMLCSQFCGINAIIYYSTDIFKTAGADSTSAFAATASIGVINLIATLVAIACVDKLGRRPLLLFGAAVQTIALGMIGWMFSSPTQVPAGLVRVFEVVGSMVDPQQAALFGCIITFTAAFAVSIGPIGWLFCSEVFPNRVRGRAMSLAAMSVWISCYIVSLTFPMLKENPAIGPAKTFWIYGGVSLFSFVFVALFIPETKGRTLEQIERYWKGRRAE